MTPRGGRASSPDRPGRDRRAVHLPAPEGSARADGRSATVVGGGIAGLAAAVGLAERGVSVTVLEADERLGGRVAAWPLPDGRTMSRGFHAFFRQYYNLRALLKRIDPRLDRLVPIEDYPLQRPDGLRDSFTGLPTTPPLSVLEFVRRSPAFTLRSLARVDVPAALELMRVQFPGTYDRYDGESAAAFLDRLRFPDGARDLALEVFARSFFADPADFAAGELIAMFHTYFIGSAEGLLFGVPDDDYDTALWAPLARYLHELGVEVHTSTRADRLHLAGNGAEIVTSTGTLRADAVVLAADPRSARQLIAEAMVDSDEGRGAIQEWQARAGATRNAPPFVVVREWLDTPVRDDRPAFLGTSGYGPLDNVSVLERFENGVAAWAREHGGSVVEMHAYACGPEALTAGGRGRVVSELEEQLHRAYPETGHAGVVHREVIVDDDCALITPEPWSRRPGVETPDPRLVLAGDWVRTDYPVALMERAATTGFLAANALLGDWGVRGHDLWTVPLNGLFSRRPRERS